MTPSTLRGDGLASAALLGLPVMELLDTRGFASLALAIIVTLAVISLACALALDDAAGRRARQRD